MAEKQQPKQPEKKAPEPEVEVTFTPSKKLEEEVLIPDGMVKVGNLYVEDLRGKLTVSSYQEYDKRELGDIKQLVVHHSASSRFATAEGIARHHVNTNKWPGIGYHFIVEWEGNIQQVNDLTVESAHVAGRNRHTVGVCMIGDFSSTIPTMPQLDATRRLLAELQFHLGSRLPIVGHRDIAMSGWETSCPGDTYHQWFSQVIPGIEDTGEPAPSFVLGFAEVAERHGEGMVGRPLEDEHHELLTVQRTTKGIMVWREGDAAEFFRKVDE